MISNEVLKENKLIPEELVKELEEALQLKISK